MEDAKLASDRAKEDAKSGSKSWMRSEFNESDHPRSNHPRSDDRHWGSATKVFAGQVKSAVAKGFAYIETHAAGSFGDPRFNGYYTWACMGYDQDIDWAMVLRGRPRRGQRARQAARRANRSSWERGISAARALVQKRCILRENSRVFVQKMQFWDGEACETRTGCPQ